MRNLSAVDQWLVSKIGRLIHSFKLSHQALCALVVAGAEKPQHHFEIQRLLRFQWTLFFIATIVQREGAISLLIRKAQIVFRGNWLEFILFAVITVVLPIYLALTRHTVSSADLAARSVAAPLSTLKMAVGQGRAPLSLDIVIINGAQTVVAALKSRHTVSVGRGDVVTLIGWAFDPAARAPAAGVALAVNGNVEFANYGFARKDVAEAYHLPNLTPVGFNASLDYHGWKPGAYPLTIIVFGADAKSYYRNPTNIIVSIRNER